jgi:Tfp pilus assembly protein PilF
VLGNTCARRCVVLTVMLWLGWSTRAYTQEITHTIRGELKSGIAQSFSDYVVQLVDISHRESYNRIEVRSDGSFELRHVGPGEYNISVTTLHGELVTEQLITISPQTPVQIRIPERPVEPRGGRTISVKELLHPPSRKAQHSFLDAQKFSSSGDYLKATEALQRALRESPGYAEARINLAVQYIRLGRLQDAAAELQHALANGGPNGVALCNLAWVQMHLGQRDLALESVRAGLRINPDQPAGHLILGALLAENPATREEAISHLKKATGMKSAQELLAKLGQ